MSRTLRGIAGLKKTAQAMKDRKSSGGSHRAFQFMLQDGESATVRFRGLFYPVVDRYLKDELVGMDMEELRDYAIELQAVYREKMTQEELADSVISRYDSQEPFLYANHYVDRNRGKGKSMPVVFNCGDPVAANEGTMHDSTECLSCTVRKNGDDGIGWPRTTVSWNVWEYGAQHCIVSKSGKEYVECTLDEDEYCKHCDYNEKQGKDGKNLRKLYPKGMRVTQLPISAAQIVESMSARIAKICVCREGKIKTEYIFCPHCEKNYDLSHVQGLGWRGNTPILVACPSCSKEDYPKEACVCTDACEYPERLRMCDITVHVERIDKTTTFTEILDSGPLDPGDELDATILATPLHDLEKHGEPPTVAQQMKYLGLDENPLGDGGEVPPLKEEPEEKEEKVPKMRRRGRGANPSNKKSGSPFGAGKAKGKKTRGSGIRTQPKPYAEEDDIPF